MMTGRIPSFAEFVMSRMQQAANEVATQMPSTELQRSGPNARYGNDEASLMNLQYGNRGLPPLQGPPMAVMTPGDPTPINSGLGTTYVPSPEEVARGQRDLNNPYGNYVDPLGGQPSSVVANSLLGAGTGYYPGRGIEATNGVPGPIVANDILGQPLVHDRSWYGGASDPFFNLPSDVETKQRLEWIDLQYDVLVKQGVDPNTASRWVAEEKAKVTAAAPVEAGLAASTEKAQSSPSGLLQKIIGLGDKPIYWSRENIADEAYREFKLIDATSYTDPYAIQVGYELIANGEFPNQDTNLNFDTSPRMGVPVATPWKSQAEWDAYRLSQINPSKDAPFGLGNDGPFNVYGMAQTLDPNMPVGLNEYDKLSPAEKAQFRKEFVDAYENGFAPKKRVLSSIGVYTDAPTGEFFEPGARAAWEYVASKQGTSQRFAETLYNDPLNAPFGAPVSEIARGVERSGAGVLAREAAEQAATKAARETGDVVLREGERIVGKTADNGAWVATEPTLAPNETILMQDDAGNYIVQVMSPAGVAETKVVAPKIVRRAVATDSTLGETISSLATRAAGNAEIGAANLIRLPDTLLNGIADTVMHDVGSYAKFWASELPVVGHLFKGELRAKAATTLHKIVDAGMEDEAAATRATFDLGDTPPPGSPPPTSPADIPDPFGGPPTMGGESPAGPQSGPPMPRPSYGRPGAMADIGTAIDAAPSPEMPNRLSTITREQNGFTYLGDGSRVRVARSDDGMFVVQEWRGQAWVDADLPAQPNLDDAVAMATENLPVSAATEQPPATLFDAAATTDLGDNPNLPRPQVPKETVRQPELAVDQTNVVGDEWKPTVTEPTVAQPKLIEAEPAAQEAPSPTSTFDPDVAYPPDDPTLPKWDGPEQFGLAEDAVVRGFENPEAGNAFFDEYRDLVRKYNETLDAYQQANRGKNWTDFKNAQDWYRTQGMHYMTPGEMAIQIEHLGKTLKAYREAFQEAPDYLFRYGDELAITRPGPLPTGGSGQDLADNAFIRYGDAMEPIYVVSYSGDEWVATNIDNVIEHAAFDPDDAVATEARRFLRSFRKASPELAAASDTSARARLVSGVGETGKSSTNAYYREQIAQHPWVWRTVEDTGERIQVPTSGKGSRPKVKLTNTVETPDGQIIEFRSGVGPSSGDNEAGGKFRFHVGLPGWRPSPQEALPPNPARDFASQPMVGMRTPHTSDVSEAILNTKAENGRHATMTARQIRDHYIPMYERYKKEYAELKAMGGDADLVSKKARKGLSGDVAKHENAYLPPLFESKAAADDLAKLPRKVVTGEKTLDQAIHERVAMLEMLVGRYGDIATTSAYELAVQRAGWEMALSIAPHLANQRMLVPDFLHALFYRLPRTLLLADPLTSWTYIMRNMMGNGLMIGMAEPEALFSAENWRSFRGHAFDVDNSATAKAYSKLLGTPVPDQFRAGAAALETVTDTGIGQDVMREKPGAPKNKVSKAVQTLGSGPKSRRTPTSKLFEKLGITTETRGNPARAYDWMRNVNRNMERAMKLGSFLPILGMKVAEAIPEAADQIANAAYRMAGISLSTEDISRMMMGLRDEYGVFSRDELHDALFWQAKKSGAANEIAATFADRGTRDWINIAKQASDEAIARTNYIFPNSLEQMNIDHYLSYVTLFHFWPTRAMAFMLEEMIRDPRIAINWWRAHEGAARMAEEGDYPDSVKGLMRIMSGPFGFVLYANPAALFLATALAPAGPEFQQRENVTMIGKALLKLRSSLGITPVPALDALLSMTGVYGDSTIPDVFPSRTLDLVLATGDVLLTKAGHRPHTPVWDQWMQNTREMVTRMLPGISTVDAGNAGGYVYDVIGSMVLEQNPDLRIAMTTLGPNGEDTPTSLAAKQRWEEIMADPTSPEYREAEIAVTSGNLMVRVVNLLWPLSVRAKIDSREETVQLGSSGRDKRDAGEPLTPGEQAAVEIRSTVTDTPAARKLNVQKDIVASYGTPHQKELAKLWESVAFTNSFQDWQQTQEAFASPESWQEWHNRTNGDWGGPVDQQTKYALADQAVADAGGTEEYEAYKAGKDALIASMPEYAAYDRWQSDFRKQAKEKYGGDLSGVRLELMQVSPSYREFIDNLKPEIKANPDNFDRASLNIDAYLAYLGEESSLFQGEAKAATNMSAVPAGNVLGWGQDTKASGGSSSSSKSDTAAGRLESLTKAQKKYDLAIETFNRKVVEITGGATWDDLSPMWQESLKRRLNREGIDVPVKPAIVADYEDWLEGNPGGTPMDYIQWLIDNGI